MKIKNKNKIDMIIKNEKKNHKFKCSYTLFN